jgi:hypothetical protein
MSGACSTYRSDEKCIQIFFAENPGERRGKYNIKMTLNVIGCNDVEW